MTKPKIRLIDIETSPIVVETWGLYPDSIPHQNIRQEWRIICAAWKDLDSDTVHSISPLSKKNPNRDDLNDDWFVVNELHRVISDSDIIIAHNGDRFDFPKINTRAIFHGFDPIRPNKSIDTLKIARKHFKFTSNRLDYLGKFLGLGSKIKVDYALWQRVMDGDKAAIREMAEYNKQDVSLLEAVYKALRPFHTTHPSVSVIAGTPDTCPKCGAQHTLNHEGFNYTKQGKRQQYSCQIKKGGCGGWSSGPLERVKEVEIV
jgi:hypothetical protein